MSYLIAVVCGFAFGAIDQYLGTGHVTSRLGWWTITVSGMSAPWLLLPFVAGLTQDRARRAVAMGVVVTMSALVGYFVVSNSPLEAVPIAQAGHGILAEVRSGYNPYWILGGLLTSPLFAWAGYRWRVARSWVGPVLVTIALCLEPLARALARGRILGGLTGSRVAWGAEIAVGLAVAAVFFVLARRPPSTVPAE
jgi:hypothetical protein